MDPNAYLKLAVWFGKQLKRFKQLVGSLPLVGSLGSLPTWFYLGVRPTAPRSLIHWTPTP